MWFSYAARVDPKKNENFPVKGAELQVKGPKKDLLFALRDVQYMQYYMYYLNIYIYNMYIGYMYINNIYAYIIYVL